jgi:hypothetical protein
MIVCWTDKDIVGLHQCCILSRVYRTVNVGKYTIPSTVPWGRIPVSNTGKYEQMGGCDRKGNKEER